MIFFTEYAYSKLAWFRINCHENNVSDFKHRKSDFLEVSLMGVSKSDNDLNTIIDFQCIPQEASTGLTEPTDEGLPIYLERMLDQDISINRCFKFWAHTHPGTSPAPSFTDKDTFSKWFSQSDIGVMYILAENDDSCLVKHKSQYGQRVDKMECYVILERKDRDGHNVLLSTKTLFAINKTGQNEGYTDLSNMLLSDYSEFEEEWMAELKENVKKKSYQYQYKGTTTAGTSNGMCNQTPHYSTTTKEKEKKGTITPSALLQVFVKNSRHTLNEFTHKGQEEIAKTFQVNVSDLNDAYCKILSSEREFDMSQIAVYEKELLDSNGNSAKDTIKRDDLLRVCKELLIRPQTLWERVNLYIERCKQEGNKS